MDMANALPTRTDTDSHSRSEHSQGGAQRREQYLYGAQRAIESEARSVRWKVVRSTAILEQCQGGEIGRRARLRISKSALSKHLFSFQKRSLSREENAFFRIKTRVREGRVETSSF